MTMRRTHILRLFLLTDPFRIGELISRREKIEFQDYFPTQLLAPIKVHVLINFIFSKPLAMASILHWIIASRSSSGKDISSFLFRQANRLIGYALCKMSFLAEILEYIRKQKLRVLLYTTILRPWSTFCLQFGYPWKWMQKSPRPFLPHHWPAHAFIQGRTELKVPSSICLYHGLRIYLLIMTESR